MNTQPRLTPDELFRIKQSEMKDEELIELCSEEISKLCKSGGRSITMCVPPMVKDTDMLFCELIKRYKAVTQSPSLSSVREKWEKERDNFIEFRDKAIEFKNMQNQGFYDLLIDRLNFCINDLNKIYLPVNEADGWVKVWKGSMPDFDEYVLWFSEETGNSYWKR